MSTVIEQAVQARLISSAPQLENVPATLSYDRTDPFAVHMTFPPPATLEGVEVVWTFARELLTSGLDEAAGVGDVQLRPYGYGRTVLELHATEGVAMVHIRTAELRRFLKQTLELVPAGTEHRYLDVDQDLAQLLSS
ncbi:SsgA family sporulation/cell division regulator [Streptomyces finlayi]|uniref:SsgA family sporulation/cell division regulator n=1 Tax=Streptomyces finlayi TaxID=67296 RepID=UPI00167B898F|nr:SsgA family sporulation/cell division regulator [Streptomyces finlayi]